MLKEISQLGHLKAPLPFRALALCYAVLLATLEILFHLNYLTTPYGTRAIILTAHYLTWGILFYRGSKLTTWVYWSCLVSGTILFSTYSDYYFFFSLAVFPISVAFSPALYNLANLGIFIYALIDDVEGTTAFNAISFYIITITIFFLLPLGIRLYWERSRKETQKRQNLEKLTREQNLELARELHDGLARHISSLTLQANKVLASPNLDTKNEMLTSISTQSRQALDDLRRMMRILRQDQIPTESASQQTLNLNLELDDIINKLKEQGFTVSGERADLTHIPTSLRPTILRTLKELAFNISKYAPAQSKIEITASLNKQHLKLNTSNPIDTQSQAPSTGQGLILIGERIKALGGTITAQAHKGHWHTHIKLPL